MIIRILNGGQWELAADRLNDLNPVDDAVEKAVAAQDQESLTEALNSLLDRVRSSGVRMADDDLRDSDLILPAADATIEDVQAMLDETDDGLIPD